MTPEQYARARKAALRNLDAARANLALLDKQWRDQETARICAEIAQGQHRLPSEVLEGAR